MFTRDEMATAAAGLPLTLLADDSVHDYEKEHLPEGAWPPTPWYPNWTAGQDVFDLQRQRPDRFALADLPQNQVARRHGRIS